MFHWRISKDTWTCFRISLCSSVLYILLCFSRYILNTMIEMPHFQQVNSLCFCPLSPTPSINGRLQQIVTSSNDGKFKLWKLSDDTNAQSKWKFSRSLSRIWTTELKEHLRFLLILLKGLIFFFYLIGLLQKILHQKSEIKYINKKEYMMTILNIEFFFFFFKPKRICCLFFHFNNVSFQVTGIVNLKAFIVTSSPDRRHLLKMDLFLVWLSTTWSRYGIQWLIL